MGEAAQTRTPEIQLFRDVFNASPIGIAVENLEGQPLFINPAFCSFLGFSEEELRKKHCVDFSPAEDAEKDWALFQQLKAGSIDHYQLEKRYFRRDGSLVWGRLIISLLKGHSFPLVLAMVEDITDKKKAEEARFRHAAVIESCDDAIATGTLDGTIVSWNKGAEKIYGYTEAEAIGKPIAMLVPPELPDEENKILEKLRAGVRIEHFETVRITKMGKKINVSLSISPIKDSSGRTVGISGIARDITERKLAEETLRKSEERFLLAAQAGKMYAYEWDVTTDVLVRSSEYVKILGVAEPQHFTRRQFMDKIHPDDRPRFIAAIAGLTPYKPTGEVTYRVLLPAGAVVWLKNSGRAFFDGEGRMVRVIGMVADVTDHKLSEEKLREYEKAVEGLEEMIVVVDREYRYLIANRKFLNLRNMTREQVEGHFANEVMNKGVFEAVVKEKLDECFQGNVVRFEMKYTYPDLGERDVCAPLFFSAPAYAGKLRLLHSPTHQPLLPVHVAPCVFTIVFLCLISLLSESNWQGKEFPLSKLRSKIMQHVVYAMEIVLNWS